MDHREAVEAWLGSPGPVARAVADGAAYTGLTHAEVALAVDALVADGLAEWCNDGRRCALSPLGAARRQLFVADGKWSRVPEEPKPCDRRGRLVTETDWNKVLRAACAGENSPSRTDKLKLGGVSRPEDDPYELAVASEEAERLAREAGDRRDYGKGVPKPAIILGLGAPWPVPGQNRGPQAPDPGEDDRPGRGRPRRRRPISCESCGSLRDSRIRRMAVAIPPSSYCAACDASGMDHRLPPPRKPSRRSYDGNNRKERL